MSHRAAQEDWLAAGGAGLQSRRTHLERQGNGTEGLGRLLPIFGNVTSLRATPTLRSCRRNFLHLSGAEETESHIAEDTGELSVAQRWQRVQAGLRP